MRKLMLYLLSIALLAIIVAIGWWTIQLEPAQARTYRVQAGDTPAEVAKDLGVSEVDLARANGMAVDRWTLVPGTEILVPEQPETVADKIRFHVIGLGCQLLGLCVGLVLAIAGGLLPASVRGHAAVTALVLALTSYFFSRAVTGEVGWLSPQVGFDMAKDGFAWAAMVALVARALGIREASLPQASTGGADAAS